MEEEGLCEGEFSVSWEAWMGKRGEGYAEWRGGWRAAAAATGNAAEMQLFKEMKQGVGNQIR